MISAGSLRDILRDRRLWLVLAVAAGIVGLRATGAADLLTLDTLRVHRATLAQYVADHTLIAGLAYVTIYAGAVALSLPGALFLTLGGGFLFGTALGSVLTICGATLGATLVFVFARTLFGDRALDRFGAQATRIADGIRRNAWSYLLALRLVPLFPFFLVNLVPAFVGVSLGTYVATTAAGIIPGTVVFSLAGAGLGKVLDHGGTISAGAILTPEIVAGLVGLAALALIAIPIRRRLEAQTSASGRDG